MPVSHFVDNIVGFGHSAFSLVCFFVASYTLFPTLDGLDDEGPPGSSLHDERPRY